MATRYLSVGEYTSWFSEGLAWRKKASLTMIVIVASSYRSRAQGDIVYDGTESDSALAAVLGELQRMKRKRKIVNFPIVGCSTAETDDLFSGCAGCFANMWPLLCCVNCFGLVSKKRKRKTENRKKEKNRDRKENNE